MSAKHLSRAGADTPDTRCANCGRGIYDMRPMSKVHDLAYPSMLDGRFDLCGTCEQLEAALIAASGSHDHPLRLAHYERMQEKVS